MPDSSADRNPVEQLAEEFAERYRRGERPALSEYTDRYPQWAGEIRELFPALVMMEQFKPDQRDPTGDYAPAAEAGRPPLEQLGDYRILREVGRGGMGIVYEAEQESLGRHVALKVLPPHALLNPTHLERFRREAKAAAKLPHTNIVPVFGVGEASGVHFYAMQFIHGEGLDKVLHDLRRLRSDKRDSAFGEVRTGTLCEGSVAQSLLTGRFSLAPVAAQPVPDAAADLARPESPPVAAVPSTRVAPAPSSSLSAGGSETQYCRSVARLGLQAAEALAYAHRQGVLHRDIKPSNLLLDTQGIIWITDFGLAKAEGADDLTQTGDIVGTIRFMAPERFDSRSLPQSDVYSLGVTLYEMLALRPAFDDTNKAKLVEKVLHEAPVGLRKIDPRVPRDLETIVLKCLAKEPAERYEMAEMLAEDLRRFLADRPIRARRTSGPERLWRWCRRNPAVASLLSTVALLLVVVAIVSTLMAARLNRALGKTQDAEREARLREAEALVGQAHGIRYSRRSGQRFEALAALDRAATIGRELGQPLEWFSQLRTEAIAAIALPDLQIDYSWDGFPPGTYRAALSRDFELYVRTTKQGASSIRRITDDVEIAELPALGEAIGADFGPGRLLCINGGPSGRCQLWALNGSEPVLRFDEKRAVDRVNFRPDGRLMALGHPDGWISVYETDTGNRRNFLAPDAISRYPHPALHPIEHVVAICSYWSNMLQVRDLESGNVLASLQLPWRMCLERRRSNAGRVRGRRWPGLSLRLRSSRLGLAPDALSRVLQCRRHGSPVQSGRGSSRHQGLECRGGSI
jgi:serine/threonine protein kinase